MQRQQLPPAHDFLAHVNLSGVISPIFSPKARCSPSFLNAARSTRLKYGSCRMHSISLLRTI